MNKLDRIINTSIERELDLDFIVATLCYETYSSTFVVKQVIKNYETLGKLEIKDDKLIILPKILKNEEEVDSFLKEVQESKIE